MVTVFDSLSLKGLRLTHLRQLQYYIENREREGWYLGRQDQFEKRHKELKDWIAGAIEYAEENDVRFPK